jgi:hypothetical protein
LTLVGKNVIVYEMNISSSEWREREKHVEYVIADVETVLKNSKVQKVLGADAVALYGISQTIFLPNVRNSVISMPKEYQDTDLVPMVALKQNEELRMDQSLASMSMAQCQVMEGKLQKWRDEDKRLDDLFAEPAKSTNELNSELVRQNIENGGHAQIKGANGRVVMTRTAARKLRDDRIHQVLCGRPLVILDTNEYHVEHEAAAITLHELEHVRQFIIDPLLPTIQVHFANKRLEQELRATRIQAEVGKAMNIRTFRMIGSKIFTTSMQDAMAVEDYRKRSVGFGEEYSYFNKDDEEILLELTAAISPVDQGIEAPGGE